MKNEKPNQCLFCDLANGINPTYTVFETDHVRCFLDIDPISEGHVLIVPKKHFVEIEELDLQTADDIMQTSILISKVLKYLYHPDGISMMQNGGAFNDVGHYHLHVFPRYRGDNFKWVYPHDIETSIESQNKRASAIKNSLEKILKGE